MKWLSAVAVCVLVASVSSQSYDDWIKTVYQEKGETVVFNCTEVIDENNGHPRIDTEDPTWQPWVNASAYYWLANLDIVNKSESIRGGNIMVSEDAWTLTVRNVTPDFFGIYHCVMLRDDGTLYLVKWGINMKGPYFQNLWDKYEMNVIIGFSAMGGFLVLAGLVIGVYQFRWIDPDEELKKQAKKEAEEKEEGKVAYLNGGYVEGEYQDLKAEMGEKGYYEEVKTPPEEEYGMEEKADPTVVSVAEVHSDSKPVYTISTNSTAPVSSMPEPEEDTKF